MEWIGESTEDVSRVLPTIEILFMPAEKTLAETTMVGFFGVSPDKKQGHETPIKSPGPIRRAQGHFGWSSGPPLRAPFPSDRQP